MKSFTRSFSKMGNANRIGAFDTEFIHDRWNPYKTKFVQIAFYNPEVQFNKYIKTKLDNTFLQDKLDENKVNSGGEECQVVKEFIDFLNENKIGTLIGQSVVGDARLLALKVQQCNLKLPKLRYLDTYDVCRKLDEGKCSLKTFYDRHKESFNGEELKAHDALNDAKMTWMLYNKFSDMFDLVYSVDLN